MEPRPSAQFDFDPAPCNPEAAIRSLGTRALIDLAVALHDSNSEIVGAADNPWLQVVTAERSKRARNLKAIQTYRPSLVECPPYDAEKGSIAYIEQVRTANLEAKLKRKEIGRGMPEKASINDLAQSCARPESWAGLYNYGLCDDDILESLAANIEGITLGPISATNSLYEHAKYEAIRTHVPNASVSQAEKLKYQIYRLKFKKEDMEALRIDVENVRYYSSVTDFYQINRAHQDDILKVITTEWIDTCSFIGNIDATLLQKHLYPLRMPLAFHSFAKLKQAVELSPPEAAKEICQTFLQNPLEFETNLVDIRKTVARNLAIAKQLVQSRRHLSTAPDTTPEKIDIVKKLNNIDVIQRLLESPDINATVLDAEVGEPTLITKPDEIISAGRFDAIVDKHIELIGRAGWENMEGRSPNGLRLGTWDSVDVGAILRGSFHGNLRNLKITRLPLRESDSSELDSQPTSIDAKAYRLLIEAEMKPTGKKPEPVLATVTLFTSTARPGTRAQDTLRKSKTGIRTTGPGTARILELEAMAMGRANEWVARAKPLRAGLPGLGQK